jgi:hypothetical protein
MYVSLYSYITTQKQKKNQFLLNNFEEGQFLFTSHWILFKMTLTAVSAQFWAPEKRITRK